MLAPRGTIDRYELIAAIGEGSMAQVWSARDRSGNVVAVKVFNARPGLVAGDATFRWTLLDETRALLALQHRNVARVHDVGETNDLLYVVTEYVDGESLANLLLRAATAPVPIPLGVVLRVGADACAALDAAHGLVDPNGRRRPTIHREVSPRNLLLDERGVVKLVDFGVGLARDRASATAPADLASTRLRYLAPEQVRRDAVGPWTDVFGVGAVLFRMLAGRAPYEAASDGESVTALLASSPPLQTLPPDVPAAVRDVVLRALAPRVEDRFASARELGAALEQLLGPMPRPDVAGWVVRHLPESVHERRRQLGPTAPSAGADAAGNGFMDVQALVAQARGAPAPTPSSSSSSSSVLAQPPKTAPRAAPAPPPTQAARPRRPPVVAIALALAAAALVALWLSLPALAKSRAVAEARAAGLDLAIDDASVGLHGVALRGVRIKAIHAPGITATAQELRSSSIFSTKDIAIHGADVRLSGPRVDLEIALAMLLADARRAHGSGGAATHVSLVAARLSWDGPNGAQLLAGDIGVEADLRGPGLDEVRGTVGRFELRSDGASFGPWSSSFEATPKTSRVHLVFDPPVPDGPSALVVWHKASPTEVTLKIRRSSFKNLGIRPSELGLPASDDGDVEASITGTLSDTGTSELTFSATSWGIRTGMLPGSVDVRAEGVARAQPGKPFELTKTTLTAGPFVANVTGTIAPTSGAFVLDALFRVNPLPCERIAKIEAQNAGPLASTLFTLGQSTGAVKVTGTLNAAGTIHFDTAEPRSASLSWLTKDACGVSIFGM